MREESKRTLHHPERDGSNGTGGLNDYTANSSAGVNVAIPTVDKKFKDGVVSTHLTEKLAAGIKRFNPNDNWEVTGD